MADVTNSAVALAISQIARDKNKVVLASGPAVSDLTGVACTPNTVHWTHDTWAFANGIGKAVVQTGGQELVLPDLGLRLRPRAGAGRDKVVLANGGRVLGRVVRAQQHVGFLLLPAAGAGLAGRGDRAGQFRRRH